MKTISPIEREKNIRTLADSWLAAINQFGLSSDKEEFRDQIIRIASDVITILENDTSSNGHAFDIGAALSDLFGGQPEALGASVETFAIELPAILPQRQESTFQTRLAALLGNMTSGYLRQTNSDHDSLNKPLPIQIAERERLEIALRESEEQYQTLFQTSPVALCLIDASELSTYINHLRSTGIMDLDNHFEQYPKELYKCLTMVQIIDVNQMAANLVNADSRESIIQNPAQLIPLGGDKLFISLIKQIALGVKTHEGHFTGQTLNGQPNSSIYRWAVVPNQEKEYARIILSLVETTTQTETETELKQVVEHLRVIHNIENAILAAKSPKSIADIALTHIESIVPCLSSAVSLFDSDYQFSTLLASLHTARIPGERIPITPSPLWDKLVQGETVILKNLTSIPIKSVGIQSAIKNGGRAIMIVPLLIQGVTIGAINLISEKPNDFSEDESEAIKQIGDSVAVAIHNAQLLKTEQKARYEADTLQKVASSINVSLDQEELLDLILTQLQLVLPYDSASILQYKEGTLVISAQHGINPAAMSILNPVEPIPPNIVKLINNQEPMIIHDTRADLEWIPFPGAENIRCWLGVPLVAKESFIGLLMLDKWEPNFYSEQSIKLALAFANHAAITIENARLYRQTQQHIEKIEQQVASRTRDLAALYEITASTSQYFDLPTILDKAMVKISATMDCPIVSIQILDKSGKKLRMIAHKGLSPAILEYSRELPVKHELMSQIIQSGEPVLISDVQENPSISSLPMRSTITQSAAAPIRTKGKIVGILGIASEQPQPFSREDIALLTSIADHIGIAIENDRLRKLASHVAVTEERERLARELHDSVTQSLFSLTLFAATARELLQNENLSQADEFLLDIATTANQTHKEMRLLLYELRPSALTEEGLEGALRRRLESVENRIGIHGHISTAITVNLPAAVEGALFQVANEALNNSLRHAKADMINIDIQSRDTVIFMEINDNGAGFELDSLDNGIGMGLANMRQRMAAIGGTFETRSVPGQGTTIIASVAVEE